MHESQKNPSQNFWSESISPIKRPSQAGELIVDVCVIGAGITGLTTACLLKEAGKSVVVINHGQIAASETAHSTAHLTEVLDISFQKLIQRFGHEKAELVAHSTRKAIERIEENIQKYKISCEFKRLSAYKFTEEANQINEIELESEAALDIGVPNELIFQAPLPFFTERAIRFDHQAQFNPLQYIERLATILQGDGCKIYEDTRMLDVEDGSPCRVITDRGPIIADEVCIATNSPSVNKLILHSKLASYRTYVVGATIKDRFDFQNLYYDMASPYHYLRFAQLSDKNYLLVGGEDHKTGVLGKSFKAYENLESWAKNHFDIIEFTHHWSGQIIEPVDGLPYIGKNPMSDHIFVATGFSGSGITFGTVAAMLLSDLITGNENPWESIFTPTRIKPMASFKNFISENIDFPTHFVSDRFTISDHKDFDQLKANEGTSVNIEGKKLAAFKDSSGEIHFLSPVCPHLGCHVQWNSIEKSWDCPCHGSRFDGLGHLLNGPAIADLEAYIPNEPPPGDQIPVEEQKRRGIITPPLVSLFEKEIKS